MCTFINFKYRLWFQGSKTYSLKQQYEERIWWSKGTKQKGVLWECSGWLKGWGGKGTKIKKEREPGEIKDQKGRDSWACFAQRWLQRSNEKRNICRALGTTEPASQLWVFEPRALTSQACFFDSKMISYVTQSSMTLYTFWFHCSCDILLLFQNQTRIQAARKALEEWVGNLPHLGMFLVVTMQIRQAAVKSLILFS